MFFANLGMNGPARRQVVVDGVAGWKCLLAKVGSGSGDGQTLYRTPCVVEQVKLDIRATKLWLPRGA